MKNITFYFVASRYACDYCEEKFASKALRRSHEKLNHVDSEGQLLEINCKKCEKKLQTSTHLRKHVSDIHGSNVLVSTLCSAKRYFKTHF